MGLRLKEEEGLLEKIGLAVRPRTADTVVAGVNRAECRRLEHSAMRAGEVSRRADTRTRDRQAAREAFIACFLLWTEVKKISSQFGERENALLSSSDV